MKWLRQLYDWVLGWAESTYGTLALFILSFIEAVFFPVPPDVLLIALALGKPKKAFYFAAVCSVASVTGALVGYSLGYYAWIASDGSFTPFAQFFFHNIPGFTERLYFDIKELFDKWDFWVIFTAGFTPIPYKVFTITSGVFQMNLLMFIIASVISRSARFFLVSGLIWKYGPGIKSFIDKYFNTLALAFTALIILGFVVIKYAF
ncbi:MAG TPA: YqaA family protein [Lentimicrobium sp.]|nr:YqaA family protein [Lentimicrobium sp.]